MRDETKIFVAIIIAFLIVIPMTPGARGMVNLWRTELKKVDDATTYETQKHVEDTCRAMIASYEADISTYEMYKDSVSNEEASWAKQALMRANRTAATYNEYILKNGFVWKGNIPNDIAEKLEIIITEEAEK